MSIEVLGSLGNWAACNHVFSEVNRMSPSSVVVMGVSGSGKNTVGSLLATRLGLPFVDGDDLHLETNKQKMAAGIPLDDADRAPWIDAIARVLG